MGLSRHVGEKFWSSRDLAATIADVVASYRENVGKRLRELRASRSMSQEDAAHAVKVAVKTWGLWERGVTQPYERNWRKIQQAFELSDTEIAAIRGTPPSPLALGEPIGDAPNQLDRIELMLLRVLEILGDRVADDPAGDTVEDLVNGLAGDLPDTAPGASRAKRGSGKRSGEQAAAPPRARARGKRQGA